MNFNKAVVELQHQLAMVDSLSRPSRSSSFGGQELLLMKRGELKVKMYQEPGHSLPHVHIDYGKRHHVASYSIDPVKCLAGDLEKKYQRAVTEWISAKAAQLLDLWRAAQLGEDTDGLIVALAGDA